MTHEGLSHQFDLVMQQWRRDIGRGTHVFLGKLQRCCSQPVAERLSRLHVCCVGPAATTDACLKSLGVRDATCVVHYSFPSSPAAFGRRLFCMVENFRNLCEQVRTRSRDDPGTAPGPAAC